jgi:hypothetical protein
MRADGQIKAIASVINEMLRSRPSLRKWAFTRLAAVERRGFLKARGLISQIVISGWGPVSEAEGRHPTTDVINGPRAVLFQVFTNRMTGPRRQLARLIVRRAARAFQQRLHSLVIMVQKRKEMQEHGPQFGQPALRVGIQKALTAFPFFKRFRADAEGVFKELIFQLERRFEPRNLVPLRGVVGRLKEIRNGLNF